MRPTCNPTANNIMNTAAPAKTTPSAGPCIWRAWPDTIRPAARARTETTCLDFRGGMERRLQETRDIAKENTKNTSLFFAESAAVYLNDIGPSQARHMAAALGIVCAKPAINTRSNHRLRSSPATVEPLCRNWWPRSPKAPVERLPRSRQRAKLGPIGGICPGTFQADGGILVGNPGRVPQTVGLKFWGAHGMPLSRKGLAFAGRCAADLRSQPDRPVGSMARSDVCRSKMTTWQRWPNHYHALRPLRVLLDCSCRPLVEYLNRFTEPLACKIFQCAKQTSHEKMIPRAVAKTQGPSGRLDRGRR